MKKTIFILIVIIFALLYFLGVLTKKETLPLSKEFFSAETPPLTDRALDLKGIGFLRSKNVDRKSSFLSKKELDQLFQLKLNQGIRNLPTFSLLLIREAKKAREDGNPERAVELAAYSIQLSPDLPQPYFELARARWQQNPIQFNKILPEVFKGQMARFRHYPSSLSFFYNFFYILSNAILMAFIIFGIVIIVKYYPLYFYNIRKNLTQDLSSIFSNGVKIFILFIPVFLRLDILWAILFWSILILGYVTNRERQFILIFLIVLVYFPFFLRSSSSFLNGGASDVILEMNEANHGNWDRGTEEKLRAWLTNHPNDPEVLFTLGLIEKRQGRYLQAEEFYRKAVDSAPTFSETFSNLGNVYLALKQINAAIAIYQQAIDLNPDKGAYHYNLYRAYSQETFLSRKTDNAFQRARQLEPGLIDYYSLIDSPNMNRLVIDEVLTPRLLWEKLLTQFIGKEGILFRLFKAWFEKIPSGVTFLAPIIFLAFLIGMSRYIRAKRFLTRCPICGSPTYRLYLGTTSQEFVCFNCYRISIIKEKLNPKIMEKKALQTLEFQKQNHLIGRVLSFFFVGFGDLWKDRPLKGILLLFLFFIFILRFIYLKGVVIASVDQPFVSLWSIIWWGSLFILFYLFSIRKILRQKPRFETKE